MINSTAYLTIIRFPVPAGYDDLCTNPKAPSHHNDHQIIDTAYRTCTQFHFTYSSQEGRIGDVKQVLGDASKDNGVGNLPDIAVFDVSFKQGINFIS